MIKVYIASPYTVGDKLKNVQLQIKAFHILMDHGYIPISPLLFHYINEFRERPYEEIMEYDFQILDMCEVVIRIRPLDEEGEEIPSSGADREMEQAQLSKKRYYEFSSINELKEYLEFIQEEGL
jgi:hypothetical protein